MEGHEPFHHPGGRSDAGCESRCQDRRKVCPPSASSAAGRLRITGAIMSRNLVGERPVVGDYILASVGRWRHPPAEVFVWHPAAVKFTADTSIIKLPNLSIGLSSSLMSSMDFRRASARSAVGPSARGGVATSRRQHEAVRDKLQHSRSLSSRRHPLLTPQQETAAVPSATSTMTRFCHGMLPIAATARRQSSPAPIPLLISTKVHPR